MIVLLAAAITVATVALARRAGRRLRLVQGRYRLGRLAPPVTLALPPAARRCDCRYERTPRGTSCVYCHRPPPTSIPSDGVPMLG